MKKIVSVIIVIMSLAFSIYALPLRAANANEPPEVGDLTGIIGGFVIDIQDDVAVDTTATIVTVIDPDGNDLTETITRINADDGSSGKIEICSLCGEGPYTVIISACDKAGNCTDSITKPIMLTDTCGSPNCVGVNPEYVIFGDGFVDVAISTVGCINLQEGKTWVTFGCSAISEGTVTVINPFDPRVLIASVSVADVGEVDETCDITVSSEDTVVTCENAFQVLTEVPEICDNGVDDNGDNMTDCADVDCSDVKGCRCLDEDGDGYGEGADCLGQDCDDSNPDVNPDAEEICDDGIDNDCDGEVDMDDSDTAGIDCGGHDYGTIISINPNSIRAKVFFPKLALIKITGTGSGFDNTLNVDFGSDDIIVLFQIPSSYYDVISIIMLRAGADPGTYYVRVGESASVTFEIR